MAQPWWKPVWSVPAAMRAVRATVVVPALFAVTYKVIADPQMALFATFGGFATLVIAGFGGTRKDKLVAHVCLALAGSIALIIGTLVSGTTWLAALVTIPVTFAIFFAGVAGPNAVSGSTAAMFAYVLPVASAGGAATIPARLAGWWLASAAGTIAVLVLSPRGPGDRLRAAAAELAGQLADRVTAASAGEITQPETMLAAKEKLRVAFTAAPYRPTGLATADQAMSSLVQLLEWGCSQVADAFDGHVTMSMADPADRDLLRAAGAMLADVRALLSGRAADPDFGGLEEARAKSAAHLRDLTGPTGGDGGRESPMRRVQGGLGGRDESPQAGGSPGGSSPRGETEPDNRIAAAHAVHAQAIAVLARGAAADALIASRRATPETIAAERRHWYGQAPATHGSLGTAPVTADGVPGSAISSVSFIPNGQGRLSSLTATPAVAGLAGATTLVARHATVRSVWFLNSLRGAVALAAAVAVADLSTVQHGFWVVLGTLSVLRTSAAATGATAWRALAGTVVGFVVGAALLLAIGTGQASLWVALPLAVLVAAYAPGTTPFLVGQAAFTVTIVVLFNLLVPVGWKVGLLRVEDVAIGCGVSLVVGVLFWPRGASSIVAQDLADAFRRGAEYLTQAVDWALSELMLPPAAAAPAVGAGIRLDDAMRGYLAEQGSKRVSKDDLWTLVNASMRLRLTANTLAGLRQPDTAPGSPPGAACLPLAGSAEYAGAPACAALRSAAAGLAGFYGQVADQVGRSGHAGGSGDPVPAPAMVGPAVPRSGVSPEAAAGAQHVLPHPHLLWVQEHLRHLGQSARTVSEPALHLAQVRRRPWWR